MFQFKDRAGQQFGRLIVIERVPCPIRFASRHYKAATWWRCRCVCGKEHVAAGPALQNGSTKSCGCLLRETALRLSESRRRKLSDDDVRTIRQRLDDGDGSWRIARDYRTSMHRIAGLRISP